MDCIMKLFKKEEEKKENKTLKILLKIFLIVGTVAGLCVIAKLVYDKFKKNLNCFEDEDDCCFDDLLDECDGCECECGECECECECECIEGEPCECEPCECACEEAPCAEEAPVEE